MNQSINCHGREEVVLSIQVRSLCLKRMAKVKKRKKVNISQKDKL